MIHVVSLALLSQCLAFTINPRVPKYEPCELAKQIELATPQDTRIPYHDGVVDITSEDEFKEVSCARRLLIKHELTFHHIHYLGILAS